jgi:hypothetical protein
MGDVASLWHRVAFDVSVSDVEELEDVMAAHGWDLVDEEPTVHARMVRCWFVPYDDDPSLPGTPDVIEWEDAPAPPDLTFAGEERDEDADPGEVHRTHTQDLMFAQEVWDRLDDDGGRNPFAPPWGGDWLPGA